jgi:uncharacterized protein (DUF305 family)
MKKLNQLICKKALQRSLIIVIAVSGISTACSANKTSNNSPNSDDAKAQVETVKIAPRQNVSTTKSHPMNHGMKHSEMSLGIADAEYDLRFIDGMIPHHEGAVIMARAVLDKSQRPELKKLANTIIQAQKQEIVEMQQWRKNWYPKASDTPMAWHSEMNHSMAMSPEQMSAMRMDVDLGTADQDFDLRFINAMIPHHEGAVVMAKDAIQKSKRSDITKLSQEIIFSQQAEIDQMQQWRKAWYDK